MTNEQTDEKLSKRRTAEFIHAVDALSPSEGTKTPADRLARIRRGRTVPVAAKALGASKPPFFTWNLTFSRKPEIVAWEVRHGFSVMLVDHVVKVGVLQDKEIEHLIMPLRTLRDRRRKQKLLTADESDKLARVLRIIELATSTFGSPEKAHRWLRKPLRRFGGQSALDMLDTDSGRQAVEDLLGRIAHGIAA